MSEDLIGKRKKRIAKMLDWSKSDTEDLIKNFEMWIVENPKDNIKAFFNDHYWIGKPKFMAQYGNDEGVRARLAEEYFNQLVASEDIEIYHGKFRNVTVIKEYFKNHEFNGD